MGDVVGVHLEIKGSIGFLTFYKNGVSNLSINGMLVKFRDLLQ